MRLAFRPPFHAIGRGATSPFSAGLRILLGETRALLALDAFVVVVLAVALGPFLASLLRYADNAQVMAALVDDDALISMQLDGMTVWPWGNPANFLDERRAAGLLPEHWGTLSYRNLPYYGGLYLDIAFLIWAPLKLLGLSFLPYGPVILRALAHLFTAFFLLAGYNLLKVHFHRVTAMLALLFIASEYWLYQIGATIHPDSLLFFLMVLQLHLCILHAGSPRPGTLVALAITAGLAQGAKMGGPALVPMTVLALAMARRGTMREDGTFLWLLAVLRDGLAAAAVALSVFFLTTPYALLDSYFFRVWLNWAKVFSGTSPISPTTFWDWWEQGSANVGMGMLALASGGLLACLVIRAGRERCIPVVLLACLGLSVFFYYALFQKYWVQLQYLVVAYWAVAAVAAIGLVLLAGTLRGRLRIGAISALLFAGLAFFALRFSSPLLLAFQTIHWREAPQYAIGAWAEQNLPASPAGVSLLSDAPTYFPAHPISDYAFRAAPLRYVDLANRLPDYFLLTRYGGNWQVAKITGTRHEPWDTDIYNMRLYQDLLGSQPNAIETGRSLPFAQRLQTIGWTGQAAPSFTCPLHTWECAPVTPARIAGLFEYARHSVANARSVSLFRLDKEKLLARLPEERKLLVAKLIASSTAADSNLVSVVSGGSAWRSDRQGAAAAGEFVGIELPAGMTLGPREVTIRWVAIQWLPEKLAIDYSDDGKTWTTAVVHAVQQPSAPETRMSGANRWDESFPVPAAGRHRFWRVRAVEMSPDNQFGLEQLSMR